MCRYMKERPGRVLYSFFKSHEKGSCVRSGGVMGFSMFLSVCGEWGWVWGATVYDEANMVYAMSVFVDDNKESVWLKRTAEVAGGLHTFLSCQAQIDSVCFEKAFKPSFRESRLQTRKSVDLSESKEERKEEEVRRERERDGNET